MSKRVGIIVLLIGILFILLPFAIAANSTIGTTTADTSIPTAVDKAYTCLGNEISKKTSITFQESVFSLLAVGNKYSLLDSVKSQKSTTLDCWPKSGCKIKETSQALLAYNRIGADTSNIASWLSSKNSTSNDLAWFLEIDSENKQPSTCTIKYTGGQGTITIGDNMKLSGSAGTCLGISSSGYLLRVRDSCLDKSFEISCDKSFITTLLYQKNRGETSDCLDQGNIPCYVLGDTHSAPSLGTTQEKIVASCMKTDSNCDYEGTLWAAMALQKVGKNIDSFVPYLIALSDDYERYFSYAFLSYILGSSDDFSYSKVIELRKQNSYWDLTSSPYNRFYDTAIGMLALGTGSSQDALEATKSYLLNVQTSDGCWNNNNVRDTAMILYAGWLRDVSTVPSSTTTNGSIIPTAMHCVEGGFSCERGSDCTSAGGLIKQGLECSGVAVCCSIKVPKKSCDLQGGIICPSQTECNTQVTDASDTQSCCLGSCNQIEQSQSCSDIGGTCSSTGSCSSGYTESSGACDSIDQMCCVQSSSSSSSNTLWIVLLAILIILLIAAILLRHRIQMWWFSRSSGNASPRPVSRPPFPPSFSRPMARPMSRPMPMQPRPSPSPSTPVKKAPAPSKEYDDTLRKLKEMSK